MGDEWRKQRRGSDGKHVKKCDEKRDDITCMSVADGVIESCRAEQGRREGRRDVSEGKRGVRFSYARAFTCHASRQRFHVSEQTARYGAGEMSHVKNNVVIYC